MRKSAYAFAAVLIASGLLANNGVASAKESNNNNITVCITAAVDEYVANETKVETPLSQLFSLSAFIHIRYVSLLPLEAVFIKVKAWGTLVLLVQKYPHT